MAKDAGGLHQERIPDPTVTNFFLIWDKGSNDTNLAVMAPLYADLRSWLAQAELAASDGFTYLSEKTPLLRE